MLTLGHAAKQILEREISGASSLVKLHAQVSDEQHSQTGGPEVLLHALESRPADFRVLRPCTGPWISRGPQFPQAVSPQPWVLSRAADACSGGTRTETVLMETLRQVGNFVDADSFTALARWLLLVLEAGEAYRALHSVAMNQPERHSLSESTSTRVKPSASVAA